MSGLIRHKICKPYVLLAKRLLTWQTRARQTAVPWK